MKTLQTIILFLLHFLLTVFGNIGFKLSASSNNWRSFLLWQIMGNLAGFGTVLALTGLLRLYPLHVVFPIVQGLAVIGVQVFGARLLFHESIDTFQWLGTILIMLGIIIIGVRQ